MNQLNILSMKIQQQIKYKNKLLSKIIEAKQQNYDTFLDQQNELMLKEE